jgi:hypothetical protein
MIIGIVNCGLQQQTYCCSTLSVDGFGPKEVATKLKNLGNSYSKELKKGNDSEKSGTGGDDVYIPKVY